MPPEIVAKEASKLLDGLGIVAGQEEPEVAAFLFDLGSDQERAYASNEWDKVRDLNPGVGGMQKNFKNMMRKLGNECSEEDLKQASGDLSGLNANDVAAVQR